MYFLGLNAKIDALTVKKENKKKSPDNIGHLEYRAHTGPVQTTVLAQNSFARTLIESSECKPERDTKLIRCQSSGQEFRTSNLLSEKTA